MTEERKTRYCHNCGAEIDTRAKICPKCGVEQLPIPIIEKVSSAWYLVPFFLALIGGIIAWYVNKDIDPKKARNFLIFGIIWSIVCSIFGTVFYLWLLWGRMLTIPMFLLSLVAFWTILYVLGRVFHLEKYGLEVGPAYFIYKSGKMKAAVEALAQRWSRLWRTLCNVSLVIAIGLVIYSVYLFVSNILRFFFLGEVATRVSLIIPGITIRLYWIPYFMIAGAVIVVTHEVAHGIAAKLEKIPIESAGVMLALVFTGAFVELNEKKFEEAPTISKLRMVAVGSATNLVTALLVFLLWSALFTPAGIMILETRKGGPLESAGLGQWDSVYAVNGTRILNDLELYNYMTNNSVSAGDILILDTNKGTIPINVTEGKWTNALGLIYYWNYFGCRLGLGYFPAIHLQLASTWILLLALAIAIFNMLPAYPFDGDKIVYYLLERVMKKGLREARIAITAVCFGLMATSIALSFMQHGLFFL